jgi:RHS repeat-associated protein
MSGISSKAISRAVDNKYKYNGKEEQRKEFADGSGLDWMDYGARMYDGQIDRWMAQDKFSEKTFYASLYQYGLNNPIYYIDINGDFSLANHYFWTKDELNRLGYDRETSDLVSHYASVYADHPTGTQGAFVRFWEGEYFRYGIDYTATKSSQNTASIENSTWHSMKADGESVSDQFAMKRGQEFGWSKIFDASTEVKKVGGINKLKKNSNGIKALGQGIHALEDAVAHKGVDFAHHDMWNDMYPSAEDFQKAHEVAKSAILVTEIMSGDGGHLEDGVTINTNGMSSDQRLTFLGNLVSQMAANGVTTVKLTND